MSKTALICGVTGQDGAYLTHFLASKGYIVYGTSRDITKPKVLNNLFKLNVADKVCLISMNPLDSGSVLNAINKANPDEIYYLAGQSSVGLSFELPAETIQGIVLGTLNILEACRKFNKRIRFYQAGSSECFGDINNRRATEDFIFEPKSPYAVAKASAFWLTANYRESYNLYACTGVLFNHESPLRPEKFVTQKIISGAKAIARGEQDKLILGRIDICRDWGWAPEYVEAMWLMLQQENPNDFVVATGKSYTLEDFIELVFKWFNLEWKDYVIQSDEFQRPSDIAVSKANPAKINNDLGWQAKTLLPAIVDKMINDTYW